MGKRTRIGLTDYSHWHTFWTTHTAEGQSTTLDRMGLNSQREDGFFGPAKDYPGEAGIQRDNSHDWWPRMVMLKMLQQYYSATNDQAGYQVHDQLFPLPTETLPENHWATGTFWAEFRACDNLQAVYWLYITGDSFLLDLGKLIQTEF